MRIQLKAPMPIAEIARATDGIYKNPLSDIIIRAITTDTRETEPGDLFIALIGKRLNGNDFLPEAKRRGAYTISEAENGDIRVASGNAALLKLANYYKKTYLKKLLHTIGITGSVGKTTTKEFLKTILETQYKIHSTKENFNNNIGLPITILSAEIDCEILIVEMGMNARDEIATLAHCADPSIAVITNIGTAHIGNLGSREAIAKEKAEIAKGDKLEYVIIPAEEKLLSTIPKKITFSTSDGNADILVTKPFQYKNSILIKTEEYELSAPFMVLGDHFLSCLAPAVAVATAIKLPIEKIKIGISSISNNNIRQKIIAQNDFFILDDSYNSSYESLIADLDMLEKMADYDCRSALIGDILELGDFSDEIHKRIGSIVSAKNLSSLYLFGTHSSDIAESAIKNGFPSEKIFINEDIDNPFKTATQIVNNHTPGEIILFKASHALELGRVISALSYK